jgi:hypothetical protein
MSTYSQYKIQLIGTGEEAGQWGNITNNNFGSATPGTYRGFEQAIGGKGTVTFSGATETLSLTDDNDSQTGRALYLDCGGSPGGAATLNVPAIQKMYIVKNGTGQTLTVQISGGTGVSIPNTKTAVVYADGTNVVTAVDHIPSLTLGAALPIASGGTGSTSTTFVNLATNVTGTLPVANGGTGITSFGTGVATWLGTPSSANLAAAVTDETGTGALVFANTPTLVTPVLGTPTSGQLSNCTVDGTNPVGFRDVPAVGTKTTSYTLQTADVGKYVQIGSGGSITIPDATFAEGDVISIFNNTTGAITITCTITTAYIAGTDSDKATVSLATRGVATILFISSTVCVITGNVS